MISEKNKLYTIVALCMMLFIIATVFSYYKYYQKKLYRESMAEYLLGMQLIETHNDNLALKQFQDVFNNYHNMSNPLSALKMIDLLNKDASRSMFENSTEEIKLLTIAQKNTSNKIINAILDINLSTLSPNKRSMNENFETLKKYNFDKTIASITEADLTSDHQ